jgi:hypothetical protein
VWLNDRCLPSMHKNWRKKKKRKKIIVTTPRCQVWWISETGNTFLTPVIATWRSLVHLVTLQEEGTALSTLPVLLMRLFSLLLSWSFTMRVTIAQPWATQPKGGLEDRPWTLTECRILQLCSWSKASTLPHPTAICSSCTWKQAAKDCFDSVSHFREKWCFHEGLFKSP